MVSRLRLLGNTTYYVIIDDKGKVLDRFRCIATAKTNLSRLKLNKREKLTIKEVIVEKTKKKTPKTKSKGYKPK